jgi:hypothetical protein
VTAELDIELADIGVRLLHDAYMAWFSAESESHSALCAWWQSSGWSRSLASAVYLAALDREEAAARDFERLWAISQMSRTTIAFEDQSEGT